MPLSTGSLLFFFFFIIKVHFPNLVRRNRLSMPTKSKQRRKRKRRPGLNTRSPRRPFRGSWRTTRKWHLLPDTSKVLLISLHSTAGFPVLTFGSQYCQYAFAARISLRSSMVWVCCHAIVALLVVTLSLNCVHCNMQRIDYGRIVLKDCRRQWGPVLVILKPSDKPKKANSATKF